MERQRRLTHRALPLVVLALAAFITGAVMGAGHDPARDAAERFLAAWQKQDFGAMYRELSDTAAADYSAEEFTSIYKEAQREATAASIQPGDAHTASVAGHDVVTVPVTVGTRAFGDISGELELPIAGGTAIDWAPHLTFPGLRPGESLDGRLRLPDRGSILARGGSALAEGPAGERSSPLGAAGTEVAGETGTPDSARKAEMEASGFPDGTPAGISGLEKAFDQHLAGQPGGELVAVGEGSDAAQARTLAESDPRAGESVKTTIDPELQTVAFNTLGGRFGGIAAVDARSGAIRALAGIALRAPQPPGSIFKIVTTVAALEAKAVKPSDQFEVVQSADVDGREISNAYDEFCGGSFVQSFAHSCNSVFAPLGAKVGPEALLDAANRFGFNAPPALVNADAQALLLPAVSSIPAEVGPGLDVAVTAIGQGKVLATPIQMASVAQTIAAGGVRHPTALVTDPELGPAAEPERVTTSAVAHTVRDLMVSAVASGTGEAAIIPGVDVAGKTGTAELGELKPQTPEEEKARQEAIDAASAAGDQEAVNKLSEREKEVDAWFAAFAPAKRPRIAVAVLFVKAEGDGGAVAAPVAREVIAAALQR